MYVELDTLRDYVDITETGDDAILEGCIQRAQTAIETFTRRVFETGDDATRYYGREAVDGQYLWLDADLYSLTSIANGDSDATAISTDDITLFPMNEGPPYNCLRLDESSASVWEQQTDYWIGVTGAWAFSDTPPADIVLATLEWAKYLYRAKDTGQFEIVAVPGGGVISVPKGLPQLVLDIIHPYLRR